MGKAKKKWHVRLNMAQTLDGHIVEPNGRWSITSAEDKRRMDRLRKWADALIYARRSLVKDNPNLYIRHNPRSNFHPVPIIVMNQPESNSLPADLRVFQKPHPPGEFWVHMETTDDFSFLSEPSPEIESTWTVHSFDTMRSLLEGLRTRGYEKILLEGGAHLNGLFFQEDLVDELFFTQVPYLWGGKVTDRIVVTDQFLDRRKFRLLSVERRKDEVFFRYKIIR